MVAYHPRPKAKRFKYLHVQITFSPQTVTLLEIGGNCLDLKGHFELDIKIERAFLRTKNVRDEKKNSFQAVFSLPCHRFRIT